MSIAINCPNHTHRILNVGPELIYVGVIFGKIYELVYKEACIRGWPVLGRAYILNFTVLINQCTVNINLRNFSRSKNSAL